MKKYVKADKDGLDYSVAKIDWRENVKPVFEEKYDIKFSKDNDDEFLVNGVYFVYQWWTGDCWMEHAKGKSHAYVDLSDLEEAVRIAKEVVESLNAL